MNFSAGSCRVFIPDPFAPRHANMCLDACAILPMIRFYGEFNSPNHIQTHAEPGDDSEHGPGLRGCE